MASFASKEARDAYYKKHPEQKQDLGGYYGLDESTGDYVWTPTSEKGKQHNTALDGKVFDPKSYYGNGNQSTLNPESTPTGNTQPPAPNVPAPTAPTSPEPAVPTLPGQLSPSTTLALNSMSLGGRGASPQMGTNANQLPAPPTPRPFYPINGRLFGGSLFGRMRK